MARGLRFSVIIATTGRDTLTRAVESARWADETIVIFNEWGSWGARAKNLGIEWASGSHICFMDDDDCYTEDAGQLIKKAVRSRPTRIHVFSMSTVKAEAIALGYIGLPMFVIPNRPEIGRFREGEYANDFYFIEETAQLQGVPIVFHPDDCIALIRPEDE